MAIQTSLQHLHRADGSAIYTSPNGYSILAAVNGPVEVQRRDELPDEAHVEVNVRPHDGVGQVKERHLEVLVANTVRDVIHVQLYPRQMVQLTLQVLKVPVDGDAVGRTNAQAESYLPVLPWLLNAACLALVDAAIPMRCMFTATIVALMSKSATRDYPTIKDVTVAKSLHVLSFSSKGELLLAESEGRFSMEDWKLVEEKAKTRCLGDPDAMVEGEENGGSLQTRLKSAIEEKVRVRRGVGGKTDERSKRRMQSITLPTARIDLIRQQPPSYAEPRFLGASTECHPSAHATSAQWLRQRPA